MTTPFPQRLHHAFFDRESAKRSGTEGQGRNPGSYILPAIHFLLEIVSVRLHTLPLCTECVVHRMLSADATRTSEAHMELPYSEQHALPDLDEIASIVHCVQPRSY